MYLSSPYSWDSIAESVLQKSASLIESLSEQAMEEIIIENCLKHLGFSSIAPQSVSIVKQPLLSIDGAAVIVQFNKYPETQEEDSHLVAGMVRLIEIDEGILPVVLVFPNTNETTIQHECIHLCQLLNNQTYQLTLAERISIFGQNPETAIKNLIRTDPMKALDLFVRLTCHKLWIELEAYNFSCHNSSKIQYNVLDRAQRSSQPFTTFEQGLYKWGFYEVIPNAMEICSEAFSNFCAELEQVEWIRSLVNESGSKTLAEALYWCKEEFETEMMFGPIED